MSRPPIPPAPPWYTLKLDDDGAARFMFGPARALPPWLLALAYLLGVMPGEVVARGRAGWLLLVRRRPALYGSRSAWSVPVPFALVDQSAELRELVLGSLAREVLAIAGPAPTVRELLESPEYLAGRASVIDARGRCYAIHRGAAVVAIVPRVPGGPVDHDALATAPDLAEIAELVALVEPRSEVLERWRERGDDS